jgi:hypothetical protein
MTLILLSTNADESEIVLAGDRSEGRSTTPTTVLSDAQEKVFAVKCGTGNRGVGVGFVGTLNIAEPGQTIASPFRWLANEARGSRHDRATSGFLRQ